MGWLSVLGIDLQDPVATVVTACLASFLHLTAPRLCTGRTAHRGSRGIALLFLDHGTRRG